MRFLAWIQSVWTSVFATLMGGGWNSVRKLVIAYAGLSDDELKLEFEREAARLAAEPLVSLLRPFQRYRNTAEASIMAISIVAFNRRPADLPFGAAAYDEQIRAAQCLVDGVNVQMDTGEGKTYAIALALPTLIARHGQVLVLTINEYLAERDRARVKDFLEFLGIEVSGDIRGPGYRGVSYSSFTEATSRYLNATYGNPEISREDYPRQAAVILDELDSILIDGDDGRTLTEHIKVEEVGWIDVSEMVSLWGEDAHFKYDRIRDEIDLTAAGWWQVQDLAARIDQPAQRVQQIASAMAWARYAQEGRDYVRDGDALLWVNPVTGALANLDTSVRMKALRLALTGKAPWIDRIYADISRLGLLAKHPLVVGLSGTASSDAFYYQIVLRAWTIAIAPKFSRAPDRPPTRFFGSRTATLDAISDDIRDRGERPTLVVAWTVQEAHQAAQHIAARHPSAVVNLLTIFDSDTSNEIILHAGDPNSITVLSAGGCRGVDVRSTHTPYLAILGHGKEPRLDRQVMGRVGRHGESFTAEFFEDPDTQLVRSTFGVKRNLEYLATLFEGEIDMPRSFGRQFKRLQLQWWRSTTGRRTLEGNLALSIHQAEEMLSARFIALRDAVHGGDLHDYVRSLEGPPEAHEKISQAIARRDMNDAPTKALSAALGALPPEASARARTRYMVVDGDDDTDRVSELATWASSLVGSTSAQAADEGQMGLRQLRIMTNLRFRVLSSPDSRTTPQTCYAVLKAAGVDYLSAIDIERARVAVNYFGATYYRKCAVLFMTQASRVSGEIAAYTLAALQSIDVPRRLEYLFPATVQYPSPTTRKGPAGRDAVERAPHFAAPVIDLEGIMARIALELRPGLLGAGPSEREIMLHLRSFAPSLVRRLPYLTRAQLERELELTLQGLVAQGFRARECKVLFLASTKLVNALTAEGVGTIYVAERQPSLLARAKTRLRFARTITPLNAMVLLVCIGAVIGGAFIPLPRGPEWIETIGDVLGLGWLNGPAGSLASDIVGMLVIAGIVADAVTVIDKRILLLNLGPAAVGIATVWGMTSALGLGWALIIGLGAAAWTRLILIAQRFTVEGSAVDPIRLLASASVVGFLVTRDYGNWSPSTLSFLFWLVVGVGFASAFVLIPIGRSERTSEGDATQFRQVLSLMRIPIDPSLRSGFLAFVLSAIFLPLVGQFGTLMFALAQVWLFAALLWFRTRMQSVQRILARRAYARIGDDDAARAALSRRFRLSLVWFAPLALGATVLAGVGAVDPGIAVLAEVAGLSLMVGWRELGGILAGGTVEPSPADSQLRKEQRALAWEQIKGLARRRVGKIGAVIFTVILIWNILTFFMNVWSLPQFLFAVWKWITGT